MKIFVSLTTTILICFTSIAQEKIAYKHCNCVDEIETLSPKPNGNYTRICNNKVIETGTFLNGVKDGEWKSYSTEGTLIKVIHYSNGVLDGDVLFNYNNGKKKLSGSFSTGFKNGYWSFFSQEGKIRWDLTYENGKPVGNAQSYDKKGKNVVVSFNFEIGAHLKFDPDLSFFDGDPAVLQDATSSGWFLLFRPEMEENAKRHFFDQKNTDSQLFLSMMEIPSEFFDTYLKAKYRVKFSFREYGLKSLQITREKDATENTNSSDPVFPFTVITDDPDKLTRTEHSDFSMWLLDSKVKEAFSMIQPWQFKNGDLDFIFYYIINEIDGREALDEK